MTTKAMPSGQQDFRSGNRYVRIEANWVTQKASGDGAPPTRARYALKVSTRNSADEGYVYASQTESVRLIKEFVLQQIITRGRIP